MRTDYGSGNKKRYGDEKDVAAEPLDTSKIMKLCLTNAFTFFQGG